MLGLLEIIIITAAVLCALIAIVAAMWVIKSLSTTSTTQDEILRRLEAIENHLASQGRNPSHQD